jgi:hypothetical protein
MPLPKVKYWSSSALPVGKNGLTGKRENAILMTVTQGANEPKTVRIATCINGAVSARLAALLDKHEGTTT